MLPESTLGIDTGDGNFTYNGDIAGIGAGTGTNLGSLEKLGSNTLTLTGTNTYSGDTLVAPASWRPGQPTRCPAICRVMCRWLPGPLWQCRSAEGAVGPRPTSTPCGAPIFSANTYLGIDTNAGDFTYNSNIAHIGAGTGTNQGGINKLGANTLTLSGANTYSGDTEVSGGILETQESRGLVRLQRLGQGLSGRRGNAGRRCRGQ